MPRHEENISYHVVLNCQEQYSIWPSGRPIPLGWYATGITGCKSECLEFIREVYTGAFSLILTAAVSKSFLN